MERPKSFSSTCFFVKLLDSDGNEMISKNTCCVLWDNINVKKNDRSKSIDLKYVKCFTCFGEYDGDKDVELQIEVSHDDEIWYESDHIIKAKKKTGQMYDDIDTICAPYLRFRANDNIEGLKFYFTGRI